MSGNMIGATMFCSLIITVLLSQYVAAVQQRIVCNETSNSSPVVVRAGERIVFQTRSYPDGYPNISCGVVLQPANPNIYLNVVLEYFLLNPGDTLTFANDAGVVQEHLSGNDWMDRRNFIFSTENRGNGKLHLNLTVQTSAQFGGFTAWIIGYDKIQSSTNTHCDRNITLDSGESYMYLSSDAPILTNAHPSINCTTTIVPANRNVRFRIVVNYLDMNSRDMIIIFAGQFRENTLTDSSEWRFSRITEILSTTKLPLRFELIQPGLSSNRSSYFIVIQSFFEDEPTCPDSGRFIDLVKNGNVTEGNLMKPFIITTSYDDFESNYENNLRCQWITIVPDAEKYATAVWFRVFQTEECCDELDIFNYEDFSRNTYSGALVAKNGMHWKNGTASSLFSNTRELVITFTSDHIKTGLGMKLEVRSIPTHSTKDSNERISIIATSNFTTPGYPYGYTRNRNDTWHFDGGSGYVLFFQIINKNADNILLDDERNTSITFYDGPFISSQIVKSFNKNNRHETAQEFDRVFYVSEEYLTVHFETSQHRLTDDVDNIDTAAGVGILFRVGRVKATEVSTSTASGTTTTTTPVSGTQTTVTPQGGTSTTTTLPPNAGDTTTTATIIVTAPKNDGNSAYSSHIGLRAVIMAVVVLIVSPIAMYSR